MSEKINLICKRILYNFLYFLKYKLDFFLNLIEFFLIYKKLYKMELTDQDNEVELWKIKRMIKNLSSARGNGTSMISLIIPSKGQICLVNKMIKEEYGTASNIKSRVNTVYY